MKNFAINKTSVFDVLRVTLIATICSLLFVLIFSLTINFVGMSNGVVMGICQGIKIFSLTLACFIGIKERKSGALKGAFGGLCYTILSIFIFSMISRSISFGVLNLIDVSLGIVAGAIGGIIAVNLRKR